MEVSHEEEKFLNILPVKKHRPRIEISQKLRLSNSLKELYAMVIFHYMELVSVSWWKVWTRFLLSWPSSFWQAEGKPRNQPAQQKNSGWLMVGDHQTNYCVQGTRWNQCGAGWMATVNAAEYPNTAVGKTVTLTGTCREDKRSLEGEASHS